MFRRSTALLFLVLVFSPLKAVAADEASDARLLALAREPQRPRALTILYGSYATLQVMDVVSTRRAIGSGAQESNPLMGAGGTAQVIAIKAAGSAASIYFAERMWKKNRVAAIVTMAAVNGISAAVVAHNARIRR